jgi:hypothetical protein
VKPHHYPFRSIGPFLHHRRRFAGIRTSLCAPGPTWLEALRGLKRVGHLCVPANRRALSRHSAWRYARARHSTSSALSIISRGSTKSTTSHCSVDLENESCGVLVVPTESHSHATHPDEVLAHPHSNTPLCLPDFCPILQSHSQQNRTSMGQVVSI